MRAQGFDRNKLVYSNRWQPYLSYWGMAWTAFFILINGLTVFWDFDVSTFLTSCTLQLRFKAILTISLISPQTSIFPSSLRFISGGKSSRRLRFGNLTRWILSLASLRSRRLSFQKTLQQQFYKRSLRWYSSRTSALSVYS